MMMELNSNGKTIEDIVQVLKRIPAHPRIIPSIKAAYTLGYVYTMLPFSIYFCFTVFKRKTRGGIIYIVAFYNFLFSGVI